jgi:hypothetical protein
MDFWPCILPEAWKIPSQGMNIQVGICYLSYLILSYLILLSILSHEVKKGKLMGRLFKGPMGGDVQMTGYTPDVLHAIVDKSKIEAQNSTRHCAVSDD